MVRIEGLRFGYGREELFRDTHLVLDPGNIYGLLGLNGAGKSTLLRLMTGLLFPGAGRISVLNHRPGERAPSFLSKVFVLPEELNLPSIGDQEYVAARAPFYPDFDHERFGRYVKELEIPTGRRLTELSYGQKKKFVLSFGLACNSSLLVLDEPTNGLDIPSKGLFRRLVAEALTEQRTFVISTHQVRDVESLIDPIVILHEGQVLFNHPLSRVTASIRMSHSPTRPPDGEGLLYSEATVGGFSSIWRDTNAADGRMDLEVLFKAVISSPTTFATLFESGGAS